MQVRIVALRADGIEVSLYPATTKSKPRLKGTVSQAERRASADALMVPPTSDGGVRYTHPLASLAD